MQVEINILSYAAIFEKMLIKFLDSSKYSDFCLKFV